MQDEVQTPIVPSPIHMQKYTNNSGETFSQGLAIVFSLLYARK